MKINMYFFAWRKDIKSFLLFRKPSFFLIWFFYLCIFILLASIYKENLNIDSYIDYIIGSGNDKLHFVVNSAFYYNISKLYANNSMIVIFNAERKIKTNKISLLCHSKNKTTNMKSEAHVRIGVYQDMGCLWNSFILNCTTVLNPTFFGLTEGSSKKTVAIKFEYPERKIYPVVMCYPPMVYESRWQQIIFATEIYHYFGADLQIQYVNSGMAEIIEILERYENKGWIRIKYFPFFDFNSTTISSFGLHPMLEVRSRNQPVAYTDCLMKYRESSEFIIVADVDDVLFPQSGSYYIDFSALNKLHPLAAAFLYDRRFAKIDVSKYVQEFSLYDSIKSLHLLNTTVIGKSVYQTANAETAWIHFPGLHNETTIGVLDQKMFHIQIKDLENMNILQHFPDSINEADLKAMQKEFQSTFKNFTNFETNNIYADSIFKCYTEHRLPYPKNTKLPAFSNCLNPLQCEKPGYVKNFNCKVVRSFK